MAQQLSFRIDCRPSQASSLKLDVQPTPPVLLEVKGRAYVARPMHESLPGLQADRSYLATVIHISPSDKLNASFLRSKIGKYAELDDVFQKDAFLAGIIFQFAEAAEVTFDPDVRALYEELQVQWRHVHHLSKDKKSLAPGPYMVCKGELFEVWRLYSDTKSAFVQSVWPDARTVGGFTNVPFSGSECRTLGIAVPSRIPPQLGPLERDDTRLDGVRLGIKDLYHLAGTQTSLCNRAFYELYPPQTVTARTVKYLISKGVRVVGKNHLSSFALQEHPTQSLDYEPPFNPRGDRYQIPGGSSSGSASAVASYEWLDFCLASDATGSVRIPALLNGCFALRPTTGVISTEGMISVYPGFDTPALLGRDLEGFRTFVRVWYGGTAVHESISDPKFVIFDDLWTGIDHIQLEARKRFVKDLERAMNSTVEYQSIAKSWSKSAPVKEKNLSVYLEGATLQSFYYSAYDAFADFRRSYEKKFDKRPFVTEVNRWIWQKGEQVTKEEHKEMQERLSTFKDWFFQQFMKPGEQSEILILPISKVDPSYRDVYPVVTGHIDTGLRRTFLSPYLGAPEVTIPIDHYTYESRISGRSESMPIAISLLGPPNSDLNLIEFTVRLLKKMGRRTKVSAGTSKMWEDDG